MAGDTASAAAGPSGLGAAAKFNPQLWKADELRAIFVVRQAELAELVRRLEQAAPGTPPQHVLITGHRGMGKSTLLHRLALAVEDRLDLRAAWAPLLFREEQYTAVSLDKFWRNALDALSEALERRMQDQPALRADVDALDAINARLDAEASASVREQQALAALREWADRHGQRLLLLVDSTEQLFEALSSGKTSGDRPLWRLRECLSQDPRFLWMSCAYTALEAHQGYHHPFHEFFAPLPLKPLVADDMRSAFLALARTFGAGRGLPPGAADTQLQQLLANQPERLEALLRLAGGNPRTTVLLYQLFAAGGHDNVHTDLQRLLDDMSPLYKDRLEHQLAVQPRQLVATLMEHWAPMSAKALAQATALPVTQVNAQLSRLETSGWVEKVRLAGTRRHGYQVAERFFNVYYLMRLAPRRLRLRLTWLVEFMRIWFSEPDRRLLAAERRQHHAAGRWHNGRQSEFSRALALSLDDATPERAQLELALYSQTVRGRVGDIVIFDTTGEDKPFASIDDYKARLEAVRMKLAGPMLREHAEEAECEALAQEVVESYALTLDQKELVAGAVASRESLDKLRQLLANGRAFLVHFCGSESGARSLLDHISGGEFFPDAPNLALALIQARAHFHDQPPLYLLALTLVLYRHPEESAEVLQQCESVLGRNSNSAILLSGLASLMALCGELPHAESVYRQAISIRPQETAAIFGLAQVLALQDRRAEAIVFFADALRLTDKAEDFRGITDGLPIVSACLYLGHTDRASEAIATLTQSLTLSSPRSLGTVFLRLQATACHAVGLGLALADLLAADPMAGTLKPLELALRLLNDQEDSLLEQPAEVQALAREIAAGWPAPYSRPATGAA